MNRTRSESITAGAEAPSTDAEVFPNPRIWSVDDGQIALLGSRCSRCSKYTFPPNRLCDRCGTESAEEIVPLSRRGTLYSFTQIHVAPRGFRVPYVIGYIDLPEGVRLLAQIEAPIDELKPGQELEVLLGAIRTTTDGRPVISYKFRKAG